MNYKKSRFLITIISVFLLSGCWDEKLIKNTRFILATGFDKSKNDKIIGTYSTPNANSYPQSSIITTVKGNTTREVTLDINDKVAETLNTSKIKMIFFGEKLAKEDGLFPYLDISLRDPSNPLNPYLVITKGNAKEYFTNPIPNQGIPSDYYLDLIENAVNKSIFTDTNLLRASRIFHNKGNDIVVPYMSKSKDQTPTVAGLALFNGDKYTGKTLSVYQSVLYNVLNKTKNKFQPEIIQKISSGNDPNIENYVSFKVIDSKRDMKLDIKNGKVNGSITMNLNIEIIESPKMKVTKHIGYFSKTIGKELTKEGNKVVKKLQNANCDGLSFGRYLMSFHNTDFKNLNWKDEAFKNADIKVKFNVKVTEYGIIS